MISELKYGLLALVTALALHDKRFAQVTVGIVYAYNHIGNCIHIGNCGRADRPYNAVYVRIAYCLYESSFVLNR